MGMPLGMDGMHVTCSGGVGENAEGVQRAWGSACGMYRDVCMEYIRDVHVECRRGAWMKCVMGSAWSALGDVWCGEGAHMRWEGGMYRVLRGRDV